MPRSQLVPAIDGYKTRVAALWAIIVILTLVIGLLILGWERAPRTLRVYMPATLNEDFVNPERHAASTVFAFAMQTQLALNRWVKDGERDYRRNIERLQTRFTPVHREALLIDYARRQGEGRRSANELRDRTRYANPIPGFDIYSDDLVRVLPDGSWIVTIALEIRERSAGIEVKHVAAKYPLHVVRMRIDPEHNELALGINGYPEGLRPTNLTAEELREAGISLVLRQERT